LWDWGLWDWGLWDWGLGIDLVCRTQRQKI
jgi:hypothetical protein